MEKVSKGQRVTITCHGLTVTGTVISADHEYRYESGKEPLITGYLLEIRTDEGHVHYWKSLIDGGSIVIHSEPALQDIEVRIRYWFDASEAFRWEQTKVHPYRCQTAQQANTFCQVLLWSDSDIVEIRWNRKGSYQGHYLISKQGEK